jgi:four helix bundle protein
MADSSLEETKYHLFLAQDLKYLDKISYARLSILADEIGRMLCGFQNKLKTYSL